ncbi:peptide-methionine (S)-S-oxide reductase MsrA [Pontibacter sp. JH31]|uniref:Peptide methionine sulfoxide reductase MsrA n=1 Tax=Pontibacter aquaedesilientis TaxID=2766980 RepID=A0ABR7XCT7_9BACT|nr:peptide-methionine (S)-S-oxide reductase MsrA [Pontibacter aquaedesilientis]MBD1396113.1 peptide-methionine (S)-S-oxide reductase MsrA [Pontibacter aquaedesilientis]
MDRRITYMFLPLLLLIWACTESGTERTQLEESSFSYGSTADTTGLKKATFAGGCFWCTEAYFERLKGVDRVVSGYTGGKEENPTYQQVSYGRTGHAEAVQILYNPAEISYRELLEVFFATHDPTTLNRQGPDVGKQYRSAIYYHDSEQQKLARAYIRQLEEAGTFRRKIVTQLEPLNKFWIAEDYHQDYYRRNPDDPYVVSVARPKVKKFEDAYRNKLKNSYLKQ